MSHVPFKGEKAVCGHEIVLLLLSMPKENVDKRKKMFCFCNEAYRPSNIIQGLIFEFKSLSLKTQRANTIKSSIYVFLIIF